MCSIVPRYVSIEVIRSQVVESRGKLSFYAFILPLIEKCKKKKDTAFPFFLLLFNTVLELLAKNLGKRRKFMGKEKLKLSLFADDMTLHKERLLSLESLNFKESWARGKPMQSVKLRFPACKPRYKRKEGRQSLRTELC